MMIISNIGRERGLAIQQDKKLRKELEHKQNMHMLESLLGENRITSKERELFTGMLNSIKSGNYYLSNLQIGKIKLSCRKYLVGFNDLKCVPHYKSGSHDKPELLQYEKLQRPLRPPGHR